MSLRPIIHRMLSYGSYVHICAQTIHGIACLRDGDASAGKNALLPKHGDLSSHPHPLASWPLPPVSPALRERETGGSRELAA